MSNIFEKYNYILKNIANGDEDFWVRRRNLSPLNIENCNGEARRDEKTRTCEICVALNETVFRNTNKPDFKHPHCKCEIEKVNLNNVTLNFPMEKLTGYLFVNESKSAMMRSIGFYPQNAETLYEIISENVKKEFLSNRYTLKKLDKYGQKAQVDYLIQGLNDHTGQIFSCHTGCTIWPNGKIKVTTPIIKD